MLRLTLYQHCRINEKSNEVYSQMIEDGQTLTVLERYLNSLTHTSYDIDEVYYDDKTVFNFTLRFSDYVNIYSYNYMKIEYYNEDMTIRYLIRYAFIEKITIVNELAQLTYKIDIWHSYERSITGMNMSFLDSLRIITGENANPRPAFYNLKENYNGNNMPVLTKLKNISRYVILAQIQTFNTAEFGQATMAKCSYYYITGFNRQSIDLFSDFMDLNNALNTLINSTTGNNFYNATLNVHYYLRIGKIYILPYSQDLDELYTLGTPNDIRINNPLYTQDDLKCYQLQDYASFSSFTSGTLTNNFKRISIGTINHQIDIVSNGTNIDYYVYFTLNNNEFSLFLSCSNKLVEITDDFEVILPTSQLNGDVVAQQEIAQQIKISSNAYTGLKTSLSDIQPLYNWKNYLTLGIDKVGLGLMKTDADAEYYDLMDKLYKSPVYSTAELKPVNLNVFTNLYYWICEFKINSDNDDFVKRIINDQGYDVYMFVYNITDLSLRGNPTVYLNAGIYYDYIKFKKVSVFGRFPNSVKQELDKKLQKGIRVIFNPTTSYLYSDSYVVG